MQKMVLLPYDRYQRLLTETSKPTSTSVTTGNVDKKEVVEATAQRPEEAEKEEDMNSNQEQNLLSQFPKTLQNRARLLLQYLSHHVTWNDKKEIIINGSVIPHSNIIDLIKAQLTDYRDFRPTGIEEFEKLLTDINAPLSLLSISRRTQKGTGNIPPPPGIPVKRRSNNFPPMRKRVKWLKL